MAAIEATDQHLEQLERLQVSCASLLVDAAYQFPDVVASFRASDSWFEISSESDFDFRYRRCCPDMILAVAFLVFRPSSSLLPCEKSGNLVFALHHWFGASISDMVQAAGGGAAV